MPQAQDNARFIFLVMFILWLNAGSDSGSGMLTAPSLIATRLEHQRASYATMASSSWGDFAPWTEADSAPIIEARAEGKEQDKEDEEGAITGRYLNLTGFRKEDGLAWNDLDVFRHRCMDWSRRAYQTANGQSLWDLEQTLPTWQNATGTVHGPWVRQPCSVERRATDYNASVLLGTAGWENTGGGDNGLGATPFLKGYGVHTDGNGSVDAAAAAAVAGKGGRYNLKHVVQWGRNLTGGAGRMLVRMKDRGVEDEERYEGQLIMATGATVDGPSAGGLVRAASATVTVEDVDGTGSSHDMRMHGVHWPRKGVLLLATTSDKFAGIFGLPHLAPSKEFFWSSQRLLNRTLDAALREREKAPMFSAADPAYASPLWTSNVDGAPEGPFPAPQCEYILYAQLHPVDAVWDMSGSGSGPGPEPGTAQSPKDVGAAAMEEDQNANQRVAAAMRELERELRFPTGAPIAGGLGGLGGLGGGSVPQMQMSAVLYSPDCAFFVETKGPPVYAAAEGQHLRGLKAEVFVHEARLWLLAYTAVLGLQIKLLLDQVRETYTPSTLGRASFYTVAMMLMADGIVFSAASAWTLTASASFLPSLAVTFAGFLSLAIGGGFLSEIYAAQEPERRRRERRRQRERQAREQQQQQQRQAAVAAATATTTTITAPAVSDSAPMIVPSDQDIDAEIAENATRTTLPLPATASSNTNNNANNDNTPPSPAFSSVVGRLTMLSLVIMFLSLAASTWWASARSVYANMLAAAYLSLWVPQIVRNVERNSRRAFAWRFMVGQSALRLAPVAYFWLRNDNVLFAQPDGRAFVVLAAWLWLQLWILAFQDVLGPRFGVPRGWAPEAWEYHPVLREDHVEAGSMPIGLVSTEAGGDDEDAATARSPHTPKRRLSSSGLSRPDAIANTTVWTMDCAICCETLDVPVVRAGVDDTTAGGVAGVLARRQYMVTPCRHIFHTACLEGWLRFRLQCPICREELPPL